MIFLNKYKDDLGLEQALRDKVELSKLTNPFNPTIAFLGNAVVGYIRVLENNHKPFCVYHFEFDIVAKKISVFTRINPGELVKDRFSDPKICVVGDTFVYTANNGQGLEENQIFLGGREWLGELNYSGRQRVEKNWAIMFEEKGEINLLYSVSTPKVLKVIKGNAQLLQVSENKSLNVIFKCALINECSASLGTNFCWQSEDEGFLVIHYKLQFFRWRIYIPRIFKVRRNDDLIVCEPWKWVLHSFRSIFGSFTKHNRNLLSCTYVSGISIYNQFLYVSYGVNDLNFGISKLKI